MNPVRHFGMVSALVCAATSAQAQKAEPPLPEGLAPPKSESRQETSPPPLPPGLGEPSQANDHAPALPPGLSDKSEEDAREVETETRARRFPLELHGFWEVRGGVRLSNDPVQPRDAILGETRLQLETQKVWDRVAIEYTGDFLLDGVLEEADFDLRRLRLTASLTGNIDVSIGRQVLTWGTGDLIFINDLFPKDWQSFLVGRDEEYLKAPSDVIKLSVFSSIVNVDLVYTPQFEHDRFITGERVSFWNPLFGRRVGRDDEIDFNAPSEWFEDDEFALRLYRTFGSTEVAAYAYDGYWKSPAGQRLAPLQATFPELSVYGASVRGTLGKGIVNAEIGYYDSRDDPGGDDPFVENSEFRFLIGYERELATEFTGAFQYNLVHMMDYDAYRNTLPSFVEARDEDWHVFTMRLTKLLMNQDLTLSSFLFYSPSANDGYWRVSVNYKVSDEWQLVFGGNAFFGEADHTFYSQFQDSSNAYIGIRFSF